MNNKAWKIVGIALFVIAINALALWQSNIAYGDFNWETYADAYTLPGYSISGSVKNTAGIPVRNVRVSLGFGHESYTDRDGKYTLTGLPADQYTLTTYAPGVLFSPAQMKVTITNADLSGKNFIDTRPISGISGVAVDEQGNPISGATVRLDDGDREAVTDANGNYAFNGVTNRGNVRLDISKSGYHFSQSGMSLNVFGNVDQIQWVGYQPVQIHGVVKDTSGNPIEGAWVNTAQGDSDITTNDGTYTVSLTTARDVITVNQYDGTYSFPVSQKMVTAENQATPVDFVGQKLYSISGSVKDSDGNLISSATVYVKGRSEAGSGGEYRINSLPSGAYTLQVYVDVSGEWMEQEVTIIDQNLADINFIDNRVLQTVSGWVTLQDGSPLPGVTVKIGVKQTTTDEDGFYTLRVARGVASVDVWKDGYAMSPEYTTLLIQEQDRTGVNFLATATYQISGKVLDEEGNPVRGVRPFCSKGSSSWSVTGSDGVYSISGILPGACWVNLDLSNTTYAPFEQKIMVDGNINNLDLTLTTGLKISGVVKDAEGQLIADAEVYNVTTNERTYTDSDGGYTFSRLTPGDYQLQVYYSSESPVWVSRFIHLTETVSGIDFQPGAQTYAVSGTVTDGTNPISGATVRAATGEQTTTDGAGLYSLMLPAGENQVEVLPYLSLVFAKARIAVSEPISDQNFVGQAAHTVSGVVLDARDRPMSGVAILADDQILAVTDSDGEYQLNLAAGVNHTLKAQKHLTEFLPGIISIENLSADLTDQNFTDTDPIFAVRGRVIDRSGDPLVGVTVNTSYSTVLTEDDGSFEVLARYSKSNWISFIKTGWSVYRNLSFTTIADLSSLEVVMGPVISVSGATSDSTSGGAVENVSVEIGNFWYAQTNESGEFETQVPSGVYVLRGSHNDYQISSRLISVPESGTLTEQNLEARLSVGVSGRVFDGADKPVAGVLVLTDGGKYSWTNNSGYYYLDGLSSGPVTIYAVQRGGQFEPAQQDLTIAKSDLVDVNFTQFGSGYTISGTVTDVNGNPIDGVNINVWPPANYISQVETTDAQGRYSVAGLSGWVGLTFSKPGYLFSPDHINFDLTGSVVGQDILAFPAFEVSGVVRDEQEALAAGVPVVSSGVYADTDSHGAYHLYLPSGSYAVDVSDNYYWPFILDRRFVTINGASVSGVNLTAERPNVLIGKVRDASGAGLGNVRIRVGEINSWTASNGDFYLELKAGQHTLTASKPGWTFSPSELTASIPGAVDLIFESRPNEPTQTPTPPPQVTPTVIPAALTVESISPGSGTNSEPISVVIRGRNFKETPIVRLGDELLRGVSFINSTELHATVPTTLAAGTYALMVTNPDGEVDTLANAYVAQDAPPKINSILPNKASNRMDNAIYLVGVGFQDGCGVKLGERSLETERIHHNQVRAIVPADLTPGDYDIVLRNPDGQEDTIVGGYTVQAPDLDILSATVDDLSTAPLTPRAGQPVELRLVVHRQSGSPRSEIASVKVRFYVGDPQAGGVKIGDATVSNLKINDAGVSTVVQWMPTEAKVYSIYAWIDPENEISDASPTINKVGRSVRVFAPPPDTTPPSLSSFTINDGATSVKTLDVSLDTTVVDSDVANVLFIEYEYNYAVARWVPAQNSGWLPYNAAHENYPWRMLPNGGLKYMQAWAADRSGNISVTPAVAQINYEPEKETIGKNQARLYRYSLNNTQLISAGLEALDGDPDLYLWGPSNSRLAKSTNGSGAYDSFLPIPASSGGAYQVEVFGYTAAQYSLNVSIHENQSLSPMGISIQSEDKEVRSSPLVSVDADPMEHIALPEAPLTEPTNYPVYLPCVANPGYYQLSGKILTDDQGQGVSGVTVTAGGATTITDSSGAYVFANLAAGSYTVTPIKSGYVFTPSSMEVILNTSRKVDFAAKRTEKNLISNGGFENDADWSLSFSSYSTTRANSGSRSLLAGRSDYGYSSARQTVTIPSGATNATLNFSIYRQTSASSVDLQMVLVLDESGAVLERLVYDLKDGGKWEAVSVNLAEYSGRKIQIYFGCFNNGSGGSTWMYVDDVSLKIQ